nr:penicillin-binding protein 2 [Corynebacterium poyangense]
MQTFGTSRRVAVVVTVVIVVVGLLIGRLAWVQLVWGPNLHNKAELQRSRVYTEPARRGEIADRDGRPMAYTMQARSLTVSPTLLRKELGELADQQMAAEGLNSAARDQQRDQRVEQQLEDMAKGIPEKIKGATNAAQDQVKSDDILKKLKEDSTYEVLVRNVDPDVAAEIASEYHGVAADHQDIRQYPNGAVGENVIGKVSMDGQGQFGFEAWADSTLGGINGRKTEDVSVNGQVIPGTLRDQVPAVDGANVDLTLDLDLQTYVQQQLEQAKRNSGAQDASAVVLDAKTAEVLAMANSDTIDPNSEVQKQLEQGHTFDNTSVSHPFEPGSVAKVITAAATIEEGLTTPDEVHQVPGSIEMSGVRVNDAWQHGTLNLTTTGIFGKSSNVGTLELAQRLGEKKFADYLQRFGVGQSTGIELPNESQGLYPAPEQWGGGTFANLPIGQGMSWTTLQMASIYQTLANGGERVEPRIIKSITSPNGQQQPLDKPKTTRVVSAKTARTVVDMFRAVLQHDPTGVQSGTAGNAGLAGYQLSGKTGTAQKVDPKTGAYSQNQFWITFAGIAPADDPRYVIAIMLDEPHRGVHGEGGQSAAPLFTDIASWLLDRDNVPPSPPMEGQLVLQAN